jgi:hypothetical protein
MINLYIDESDNSGLIKEQLLKGSNLHIVMHLSNDYGQPPPGGIKALLEKPL